MKNFLFLTFTIITLFVAGVKINNYIQIKNKELSTLRSLYSKGVDFCKEQPFRGRGEFNACVSNSIGIHSKSSLKPFEIIANYCEFKTQCLADKHICIDEILYIN